MRIGRIRSLSKSGFSSGSRAFFLLFALPWGLALIDLRQRKIRPRLRVIGIKLDGVSGKFDLLFQINPTRTVSKSQSTKQCVISLRIFRARKLNVFFFATSKLCFEGSSNLLRDVTLGGEDVDQLSVVCFRPKM